MIEEFFRTILLGLMLIFIIIKVNLTNKYAGKTSNVNNYPPIINFFQSINAFVLLIPFINVTGILDDFTMNLYEEVRLVGIFLFIIIIGVMIWQMNELGNNISATHNQRFLVTSGPYNYIRHPLYSLFMLMAISMWMIAANWIFMIAIILTIIAGNIRANYEERLLTEEYGKEYETYRKSTGKFIPYFRKFYN